MSLNLRQNPGRFGRHVVAAALIPLLAAPVAAALPQRFDGTISSTRSTAMGGAFTALADDITSLMINPAGLVNTGGVAFYGDYSGMGGESRVGEGKLVGGFERWGVVIAAAGSRKSLADGTVEGQLIAGFAVKLLSGSVGSFISAGADLRAGRVSFDLEDPCVPCGARGGRYSYNALAGDLGLMVRPLPFISFALSVENISQAGFGSGDYSIPWERSVRYGAAWLHEDRFTVSWEGVHVSGKDTYHFGFSLRTALPLEIMAGISSQRVSGGARWDGGRWRFSMVFRQVMEGGVEAGASLEIFFGRPEGIYR